MPEAAPEVAQSGWALNVGDLPHDTCNGYEAAGYMTGAVAWHMDWVVFARKDDAEKHTLRGWRKLVPCSWRSVRGGFDISINEPIKIQ